MADVTVSSDVDTLLQTASLAAFRAALNLDVICDAYVSTAAASNGITATTFRNVLENATLSDAGLTDSDWTVDDTGKQFTYTGSETRTFMVTICLSMTCSRSTVVSSFAIAKNTTVQASTTINRKIGTGSDEGAMALQGIVSLATNDDVQLYGTLAVSSSDTLTVETATIMIQPID